MAWWHITRHIVLNALTTTSILFSLLWDLEQLPKNDAHCTLGFLVVRPRCVGCHEMCLCAEVVWQRGQARSPREGTGRGKKSQGEMEGQKGFALPVKGGAAGAGSWYRARVAGAFALLLNLPIEKAKANRANTGHHWLEGWTSPLAFGTSDSGRGLLNRAHQEAKVSWFFPLPQWGACWRSPGGLPTGASAGLWAEAWGYRLWRMLESGQWLETS